MSEKLYSEEDILKAKDISFRDGLSHSSPSHETMRRLEMLEKDIDKVISSNGFLSKLSIGVVIAIGVWVGTIQSRQLRNISDIATNAIKYESVEQRIQKGDVAEAEIRTKLVGIETTLEEIKVAVKNIR